MTIILNRAGPAFEAIVNSAQARDSMIGLEDLVGLLLSAKMRHIEQANVHIEPNDTVLNMNRSKSSARGHGNHFSRSPQSDRGHDKSSRPTPTSGSPLATHNTHQTTTKGSTCDPCQICDCLGHLAINCYHCMDRAYEG